MAQLKDTAINGYLAVDGNIILKDGSKLFYEAGDSIDFTNNNAVQTTGFVNDSGDVVFTIPINRPVIGSPKASVEGDLGFMLRQNGKYTHGSTSSTYIKPSKYQIYGTYNSGIIIRAEFDSVINAVNNDVIGICWVGKIAFD